MDVLALALVVALVVWSVRKLTRLSKTRRLQSLAAQRPGYTADNPLVLQSGKQMQAAIDAATCACGGRVKPLGETPRLGLRVARGRCLECDEEVDLYFVMPKYLN